MTITERAALVAELVELVHAAPLEARVTDGEHLVERAAGPGRCGSPPRTRAATNIPDE